MVPIYVLVALAVALAAMPIAVFAVDAREVGTVHAHGGQLSGSSSPQPSTDGGLAADRAYADLLDRLRRKFHEVQQTGKRLLTNQNGVLNIGSSSPQSKPLVKRQGSEIILPASPTPMSIASAIEWLVRIQQDEETVITVSEPIEAYPWDGARAARIAAEQMFGFVAGSNWPPQESISVAVDVDDYEPVIWGNFTVPNIEGTFTTGQTTNQSGQKIFQLSARLKKKHEYAVHQLAEKTRELLKTESIYRGKALSFTADEAPTFIDVSRVEPEDLIYSGDVMDQVRTTVFTPIEKRAWLDALHVPFKRGVALVGQYGTGKTLAIYVAALKAKQNGITFLLCEDATELPEAMLFARQYAPAVVAVEDIDRVTSDRNALCNSIMDALDGIESKDRDVMVVMTSNEVDNIHEAMRRPGRIDTFIHVSPPDALAVERLLRLYGRGLIHPAENLMEVCEALAGQIPAVVAETVKQAKLAAIERADTLDEARVITSMDLRVAARGLMSQRRLLKPRAAADTLQSALAKVGAALRPELLDGVQDEDREDDIVVEKLDRIISDIDGVDDIAREARDSANGAYSEATDAAKNTRSLLKRSR